MSAQIIPFQTRTHRLLALALAWYRHLTDDYASRGLILPREDVIRNAVIEAKIEDVLGWRYWEDPERGSTLADLYRDMYLRDNNRTEWLQCWLNRWLHGRLLPVKRVPPRRPRCSKATREKPVAAVVSFPARRTARGLEAVAK